MKSIMITGASSGIGRATAELFLQSGWRVGLIARRADVLDAIAEKYETAVPLPTDVTDAEAMEAAFEAFGQLDVLFNNAGLFGTAGTIDEIDLKDWMQVMNVNIGGMFIAARLAFARMRAQDPQGGRIINIGSMAGKVAMPLNGSYTISKFGVEAFSDSLRQELQPHGIKVSLVEPGPIATPMISGAQQQGDSHLARLPPQATQHYGERMARLLAQLADMERKAPPPAVVVKAVEHALESARPKTRYVVTREAKLLIFLRWLLPDRALDFLLAKMLA